MGSLQQMLSGVSDGWEGTTTHINGYIAHGWAENWDVVVATSLVRPTLSTVFSCHEPANILVHCPWSILWIQLWSRCSISFVRQWNKNAWTVYFTSLILVGKDPLIFYGSMKSNLSPFWLHRMIYLVDCSAVSKAKSISNVDLAFATENNGNAIPKTNKRDWNGRKGVYSDWVTGCSHWVTEQTCDRGWGGAPSSTTDRGVEGATSTP